MGERRADPVQPVSQSVGGDDTEIAVTEHMIAQDGERQDATARFLDMRNRGFFVPAKAAYFVPVGKGGGAQGRGECEEIR